MEDCNCENHECIHNVHLTGDNHNILLTEKGVFSLNKDNNYNNAITIAMIEDCNCENHVCVHNIHLTCDNHNIICILMTEKGVFSLNKDNNCNDA